MAAGLVLGVLARAYGAGRRAVMTALDLALSVRLPGSAWALRRGRGAWAPFLLLSSPLPAAVGVSIHWQGPSGLPCARPTKAADVAPYRAQQQFRQLRDRVAVAA